GEIPLCGRSGGPFPRRSCRPSCAACGRAYPWVVAWSPNNRSSERNIFRVNVARRFLATAAAGGDGGLGGLLCGRCRLGLAAGLEELDFRRVDFGGLPFLPILTFPGPGLQPALDINQAAFVQVLARDLSQVALADVPDDDVVVVGVFLLFAVRPLPIAIGRQREGRHRRAAWRVAHLGITG